MEKFLRQRSIDFGITRTLVEVDTNDEKKEEVKEIKNETVQYFDLPNGDFNIEDFIFKTEETIEDIKKTLKTDDDIISTAIKYDLDKDEETKKQLEDLITEEQNQLKKDIEFLTLTENIKL